tara:strand:- start:1875 stop:2111 length:237 start_codon:yes stop_codon:yes gene_type:complete
MTDILSAETTGLLSKGSSEIKQGSLGGTKTEGLSKYLGQNDYIREESEFKFEDEEVINIDNLQTELDKFTNNINDLKT